MGFQKFFTAREDGDRVVNSVMTVTSMHDPLPPMRFGQVAQRIGDGKLEVTGKCFITGKEVKVTVREEGVWLWIRGMFIQKALFDVSQGDREFLMSGTSSEGWKELFPECQR